MAEHFRFFNDVNGDREYRADEFAEYFGLFLSDGLFSVDNRAGLKVIPGTGMQIQVESGYAFIRGYMYKNDSPLNLIIDPADSMLDRIDRVVIRFDEVAREIHVAVKKGISGSEPQPPVLDDTGTVKELSIAQIKITNGATAIATQNITDERITQYCGLVNSLITIPAQEIWDVWNKELTDIQNAWNSWFTGRQNDLGVRIVMGATETPGLVAGDIWLKELT